jgi:PAS domain S-box-containing protein
LEAEPVDERVLVLAPTGRDASLATDALRAEGVAALACADLDELCAQLRRGAGAALIAKEAFDLWAPELLESTLDAQPVWSDLPIVLLTRNGAPTEAALALIERIGAGHNVTLLERPIRVVTLVSAARSALRARRRQYENRDQLLLLERSARALLESEQRYRLIGESLPFGVWMTDAEGEPQYYSAAFLELLGCTLEQCRGFGWLARLEAGEADAFRAAWRRSSETGAQLDAQFRVVGRDGRPRTVLVRGCPVRDETGRIQGWVGINLDVSERQALVEELEAKARELARSNAELQQFAYVASHDLQAPLRSVSSFCQLLERRYADKIDEQGREFIQYAVEGAQKMQALIQALLSYSRVGRVQRPRGPVDLNEVVTEARRNLELDIRESGATVASDPLPVVRGDRILLVQLVQNLLANAIRYRSAATPRIRVGVGREGGDWAIRVEDNGVGFEPEFSERIFAMFQRLDAERSGTGIGLSICRKIAEQHGGRIWASSEPGKGSAFTFTLPASGSAAAAAAEPDSGAPAEARGA